METKVIIFLLCLCLAVVVDSEESLKNEEGFSLDLHTLDDDKFISLKKDILHKVMLGTGLDPDHLRNFDPMAAEMFARELKEVTKQFLPHRPELQRSLVHHIMTDTFEDHQAETTRDPAERLLFPR